MTEIDIGSQIQHAIRIQEILRLSLKEVSDSHGQVLGDSYQEEAKRVRTAMNDNRKTINALVGENEQHKREYKQATKRWWE